MTTTDRRTVLKAAALPALGGLPWRSARAQAANTIKVALLCDFSGTYRDVTGPTELACVRQAAAEFANRGFNIEVVFADNQNRADVGSNVTRQWLDRDGVDVVVDGGASSVALAVNEVVREKNKAFLASAPVAWLPFPPEMTNQLRRLGLPTLGAKVDFQGEIQLE